MQNIEKLRALGFTVQEPTDVVGCTEVLANHQFYAYNPRFAQTPEEVVAKLQVALPADGGRYRLLLAGSDMLAKGEISYSVLTQNDYTQLHAAHQKLIARQEELAAAQRTYDEERAAFAAQVGEVIAA